MNQIACSSQAKLKFPSGDCCCATIRHLSLVDDESGAMYSSMQVDQIAVSLLLAIRGRACLNGDWMHASMYCSGKVFFVLRVIADSEATQYHSRTRNIQLQNRAR